LFNTLTSTVEPIPVTETSVVGLRTFTSTVLPAPILTVPSIVNGFDAVYSSSFSSYRCV
jgi:hypothetical protein